MTRCCPAWTPRSTPPVQDVILGRKTPEGSRQYLDDRVGEGVLTHGSSMSAIRRSAPRPRPARAHGRRPWRRSRTDSARPWSHFAVFGAPGLLVYGCFVLVAVGMSFGYSLTNYNPFNPPTRFVGLHNYRMLLHDDEFLTSLRGHRPC